MGCLSELTCLIRLLKAQEKTSKSGLSFCLPWFYLCLRLVCLRQAELWTPLATKIGIPAECVPLAILKPVSGSGALTVLESIFKETSPDSLAGMVASVMAGSTETTFYTLAVYFAATKVRSTRYALASALLGDFTAIILSCIAVRLMM